MKNIIFMSVLAITLSSHSKSFAEHQQSKKHYCSHSEPECPVGYRCSFTGWNNEIFECIKDESQGFTCTFENLECPAGYICQLDWSNGPFKCVVE